MPPAAGGTTQSQTECGRKSHPDVQRPLHQWVMHHICGFPCPTMGPTSPQAQDTLNLMRQSRVDPTKSAYEVLEGPYDWNKYPLAPPGCKAIIHEAAESRASWAPRGGGYMVPAPIKGPLQMQ